MAGGKRKGKKRAFASAATSAAASQLSFLAELCHRKSWGDGLYHLKGKTQ
jgi:hypothetical protein